jgi:hypothetical protein
VASPSTTNPVRRNVAPVAESMIGLMRSRTENATDSSTPLINADTGAGA